jgi:hypothetical protein
VETSLFEKPEDADRAKRQDSPEDHTNAGQDDINQDGEQPAARRGKQATEVASSDQGRRPRCT